MHIFFRKQLTQIDNVLFEWTSCRFRDITYDNFVRHLYRPVCPESLGVARALFGSLMLLDGPEERGGADMDRRWGDPLTCHFPLGPLRPLELPHMALVYAAMWLGALLVALGWRMRVSCTVFTICYWYLLLLDKSFWNNHSYLFGLVGFLFIGTQANNYASLDAYWDASRRGKPVPYWNYFILKYQFFVLYFVAGLKKGSAEWLSGYAMVSLSEHWVFGPFKLFLSPEQTDYLVVHWFAFLFDLTVGFWLMRARTRLPAMLLAAAFHLMNSRLFTIGMFPWVCLVTMPLFCTFDWPTAAVKSYELILAKLASCKRRYLRLSNESEPLVSNLMELLGSAKIDPLLEQLLDLELKQPLKLSKELKSKLSLKLQKPLELEQLLELEQPLELDQSPELLAPVGFRQRAVTALLLLHMILQAVLPFSHSITKGYNNWTNGLYGYSWDMMVHNWDVISIAVRVVDNEANTELFVDPEAWTLNDRWAKHADMVLAYAGCVRRNLRDRLSANVSVYVDVWCSLNGRFQQRMWRPDADLLRAHWAWWRAPAWALPLLDARGAWRARLRRLRAAVERQHPRADVLFVADFPGLHLDNYMGPGVSHVSLRVLRGRVSVSTLRGNHSHVLERGHDARWARAAPHRVRALHAPAYYMYSFLRAQTAAPPIPRPKLPLWSEFVSKITSILIFFRHIGNGILNILFEVPMIIRTDL